MNTRSLRIALFASAATAVFAINSAAAKSDAPAVAKVDAVPATAAPVPQADTPQSSEPDIVVTATKTSERLKDVPASIAVVTATDLSKEGSVRFTDYASRVPGLSLTTARTGNTQIVLRGITTGAAQPGSTTGFYIDEAPVGSVNAYTGGNGITPDLDPSDLAQIEVLKGPQGTLYGAGAVGGLLKFTTATPSLDKLQGALSGGINAVAGGGVGYSARGMINIPLATDQLAFHASGFYRYDPGYVDNINPLIGMKDVNFARIRGGRAVLSMKLGPAIRVDLSAIGQDTTSNGTNTVDIDAKTLKPIYGDLKQSRFVREQGFARLRLYNATVKADLAPNIDFVSSTTYQRIFYREIGDGTRSYGSLFGTLALVPDLGVRVNTIKHTDRWSEEARVSARDVGGLLDLQAGFYWTHENDINRIPNIDTFSTTTGNAIPKITIGLPPAILALLGLPGSLFGASSPYGIAIAKIDSSYEEYSVFGNARLHIGSKFDILGGIRYSHDKQVYDQDYRGLLISVSTANASSVLAAKGGEKANVTTWMISPRFKASDNLMIYGRAATGYRPGGPNPAPPTGNIPLTFQPDKLTQYEVGFKAQTSNRKLSLDAALFTTDWNNIQIQTSAGGFNYLVNGGKARSQGGEATLRFQPVNGLTLGANVGYTDAKLTTPAPAAGGVKGDRLPYVPHWAGSLTADYTAPLGGDTKLVLGAAANYTGDRTSDYSKKFPKHLPAYTTFDLRAGISIDRLSLTAFVKNLTDRREILVTGAEGLSPSNTAGQLYLAGINQPRTIGAEASIKF